MRNAFLLLLCLNITGCVSKNTGLRDVPDSRQATCLQFYQDLDQVVFAHHVEDTGEMRVPGFRYLRSNRFLASFSDHPLSEAANAQWLALLRQLDERARRLEFANLPRSEADKITSRLSPDTSFEQHLQECGQVLLASHLAASKKYLAELSASIAVPDNYQTWKRIVGAYPLLSLFAETSLDDLHRELNAPFQLSLDQIPVSGKLIRYRPGQSAMMTRQEISAIVNASYRNPLQIPLLSSEQFDRLLIHFAPVWEIDTRNNTDLIGTVTFDAAGKPLIDTETPTVYVKQAYTRFHGENLLQLVYQIWMPAREKSGLFDLYGGELDSVIWRVTLNREGMPIAYDSIHACGCYYKLFPGHGYTTLSSAGEAEAVLVPKQINYSPHEKRLLLRLATRTHYIQQISASNDAMNSRPYRLKNYDRLRSLGSARGERDNLFGHEGIIESSRRAERFILWPFGIASPGAMRQWGSHAIAFVGRRHFDEPFLLEKLLVPKR